MIDHKTKGLALIYLVAVIVILGSAILFNPIKNTITGFAVANASNETTDQLNESIDEIETNITEEGASITNETSKEKGPKKGEEQAKPEKPEPNTPPVWKSDVDEFIIYGTTIINLDDYFFDKNNDTIGYAATAPENIAIEINGNLATITPAGHNFNATIKIAASDGDKSTTKEVTLIIPEKTIIINLEYKSGSIYDVDDDGVETTDGIIDLTVENSNFNWDVDESKLCTRWETYSIGDEESTIVCYGSQKCCQFVGLMATKPSWKEPFYSSYGIYGATSNNIVSAQVLYVDYELDVDEPFAEIYNSDWSDLSASYYSAFTYFENVCVDTCILVGFNDTSYKLIFEIEDAVLELNTLTYTLIETIDQVSVALDVEDNKGLTSGTYNLYKDNVLVTGEFVEPDYYDIEIIPEEKVIKKLLIRNTNITEPLTAVIGIDNVSREQKIKDVKIKKRFAVDTSNLDFETATLTAVAQANSLWKCKQWDYETEVCYGTWEKIKDLTVGEEYELSITANDPGFVEGNLNITPVNITPINITKFALIKNIPNISIIKNNNYTINLNQYFSGIDKGTKFSYYEVDNISILFDNNIATIVPDKDFVGTRFTYITAKKSKNVVVSNVFSVNITKKVAVDTSPLDIIDSIGVSETKIITISPSPKIILQFLWDEYNVTVEEAKAAEPALVEYVKNNPDDFELVTLIQKFPYVEDNITKSDNVYIYKAVKK